MVNPNSGLELRSKDGSKVGLWYLNPEGLVIFLLVLFFQKLIEITKIDDFDLAGNLAQEMHKVPTSKNWTISRDKFIIKYFLHLCELIEKFNWANLLELSVVMPLSSRKFHHLCIYTVEIGLTRLQTKY